MFNRNMGGRSGNINITDRFLPFTEEENALIMGTVLGDANLHPHGATGYRLKIEHGIAQRDYVQWKRDRLIRLCPTTQPPRVVSREKGDVVIFYTSSGRYLRETYELFYIPNEQQQQRRVKTITQNLIDRLPRHPLVLAAWYMDDGGARDDCFAARIASQSFTAEENLLLCNYLGEFGIYAYVGLHSREKDQYNIVVPAESFGTLVQIIEPYVRQVPCLVYKLNDARRPFFFLFYKTKRIKRPRNDLGT